MVMVGDTYLRPLTILHGLPGLQPMLPATEELWELFAFLSLKWPHRLLRRFNSEKVSSLLKTVLRDEPPIANPTLQLATMQPTEIKTLVEDQGENGEK
mmetsp:Transcript_6634/g.14494  ORF Transcript_6634/g.14494 Transcript_6634/m.14494 type:complete len:98 (+) Transcript_6634:53-346(+)